MDENVALHRSIVVVDVAGFTDPQRTMVHQVEVHKGLYAVLEAAFTDAAIDLASCTVEDRGDGALVLVPADVPKSALAVNLPDGLLRALQRYNAVHSPQAAVKLRVAMHAGEVRLTPEGAVSQAVNLAFRILDAGAARRALQRGPGPLVIAVSDPFYQDVIAQDPAAVPREYSRIPVTVKRTSTHAWVRSPGFDAPGVEYHITREGEHAGLALSTRRRILSFRRATIGALIGFGALSSVSAVSDLILGSSLRASWTVIAAAAVTGLGCGVVHGRPRSRVRHTFKFPNTSIKVTVGNLFDQPGHIVVGFTDTFDTDTTDDLVISSSALQGQLLSTIYGGDRGSLDRELAEALSGHEPVVVESSADKRAGKLHRYPVGTVAVLSLPGRRVFCLAYSVMGNNLVAGSNVDRLWLSLGSLWQSVAEHGRRAPLAMPVIGSELARIDQLDRESLLKLIVLSYIARSRAGVLSKELTLVVHPKDAADIDMVQVRAFLRRL